MHKKSLRAVCALMAMVWLSGCGVIDYFYLPPPEDTAQELFETANDFMAEKDYLAAAERYNKLRDAYPFSPYTVQAELSLGDAYFLDGEYAAAVEAYKDFEALHPRHESIAYVLYQIGAARLKGFISIDRPTNDLQEGYEYFGRLVQSFPGTDYAQTAPAHMQEIRKLMAEHEVYVGDVFFNMDQFGPAWRRYTYVVDNFKDVPEVAEHAQKKSLAAHHEYTKDQSQEKREKREGTWKNWFEWL